MEKAVGSDESRESAKTQSAKRNKKGSKKKASEEQVQFVNSPRYLV